MHAVIFELKVNPGRDADYFALAKELRAVLESMDGFLGIERYQSVTDPEKFVSISLWRDEAAIAAWRAQSDHRQAQNRGQSEIFSEYRLLVGDIVREYRFDGSKREEIAHRAEPVA